MVAETGSTNTDVAAAARAGVAEGLVLAAEHQRAGRGRAGRSWSSPPRAGLTVSMLLRPGTPTPPNRSEVGRLRPGTPTIPPAIPPTKSETTTPMHPDTPTIAPAVPATRSEEDTPLHPGTAANRPAVPPTRWGWLPLLAGVALVGAVSRTTGLAATLKWPNDLLVNECKVAGILAEVVDDAVVLGVGLNVTQRAEELPAPGPGGLPATSLRLAGAAATDRDALLAALLEEVARWYGWWRDASGDPDRCGLRAAYLGCSATAGRPVRAVLPGGSELAGTAQTVDSEGRLVVATPAGARALAAGDVTHLR